MSQQGPIKWMAGYRPGCMRGMTKVGESMLFTPSIPSDAPTHTIQWWEWHLRDAAARYGEDRTRFAALLAFQDITVVNDTAFIPAVLEG